MNSEKRTYVLPAETLQRFEREVAPGKRSAKVAELIESWIAEHERQTIRQDIIAGCSDMWDVYLDTAREWAQIDCEVDCAHER